MSAPAPAGSEQRLVEAARGGDEDAFRTLIEPHRGVLYAHCYRMLGSPHDAEDALQEALLRSWRGLPRFRSDAPLRPWLFRIATNVCLDAVARRPRRVLTMAGRPPAAAGDGPGTPLVESVWLEPYPDERHDAGEAAPGARYEQRESVELAFVAALQHLPARQRAVLLLRDVLGFSAREVAEALETTIASVNSALQRARSAVVERVPARSQQETLRSLGDARLRELVQCYVDAWERNDVEAIRALLVEDAIFAMPPYPSWWQGRDAVVAMFAAAGAAHPAHRDARQRSARGRVVHVGSRPGCLYGVRARGHHRGRRTDRADHRVRLARPVCPLRTAGRAATSLAAMSLRAAGGIGE